MALERISIIEGVGMTPETVAFISRNWLRPGEHLKIGSQGHTLDMTNKEIVEDLLRRIPDDASLHDIARELEFIAAVRQGVSELDHGQSVSIEEVERELPSRIIK